MIRRVCLNTTVVETWDDNTRTVTYNTKPLDATNPRPYTAEENAQADARIAEETALVNTESTASKLITIDLPNMQAILNQTNADIKTDPSQEIKDIARAVRRLVRRVEKLTDGVD